MPSPDLIRAVALSRQLKSPDGEIARELGRAFGELDPETFGGGPEAWKVANNLLLVAACLRALLLAPESITLHTLAMKRSSSLQQAAPTGHFGRPDGLEIGYPRDEGNACPVERQHITQQIG